MNEILCPQCSSIFNLPTNDGFEDYEITDVVCQECDADFQIKTTIHYRHEVYKMVKKDAE